jgi:DNA polymerase-3 subunit epsilon/ATP-dependent DNA helicase DinG
LGLAAGQAVAALGKTFNGLDGLDKDDQLNDFRLGLVRFANKLDEIKEHLESAVDNPDKSAVYWISTNSGDAARTRQDSKKYHEIQSLAIHAAPLEVSQRLNQDLFSSKDTVVLTSATLASGRSFQFTATRLGIDADNEVLLDSPFDYMQSALLCLTDDIPLPDTDGYQSAVEKALNSLLPETNGRTLVLFTSHLALRKTHSAIKPVLEARKIRVLGQGIDGSAEQVLMDFKSDPRAVLLGASSLWEGIDVVGEALSVLVIPRLPFSVPTDPVFSARSEGYADPFTDYALPQAVLRFKQGFGRLIRSRSDRGAVVLLDRRIHQRSYGQAFIEALPPCNISRNKLSDLPRVVSRWLALFPPQAAANKG